MNEPPHDFGTGLRAHLGLEEVALELVAAPEAAPDQVVAEAAVAEAAVAEAGADTSDNAILDTLIAFETELLERERDLAQREATFAGRAGALLATAKALYDEVLTGKPAPNNDELARMRRRKSGVA